MPYYLRSKSIHINVTSHIENGANYSSNININVTSDIGFENSIIKNRIEDKHVHFTHIFNTFLKKKRNADPIITEEMEMVQLSWKIAADFAYKNAGIKVEFLCIVLKEDLPSCPHFSKNVIIDEYFTDPFDQKRLPMIGTVFQNGQKYGKGRRLIYTNADIGTMKDFYINIDKISNLNPYDMTFLKNLTDRSYELLQYCLDFKSEAKILTNTKICQEDAKMYYKLHGGDLALYSQIKRYFAKRYAMTLSLRYKFLGNGKNIWRKHYLEVGGLEENIDIDFENRNIFDFLITIPKNIKVKPNAFTVTRVDLDIQKDIFSKSHFLKPEEKLENLLKNSNHQSHPGNDCFVMPRNMIPGMVLRSKHPLSWRPWGMWITSTFEWEFGSDNISWQRFEATSDIKYTFHIGISGKVTNRWVQLFNQRPLFILELAAKWNEITKDRFAMSYKTPKYCSDTRLYRHFNYCKPSKEAKKRNLGNSFMKMSICKGSVRYACSNYQYVGLRDAYNYNLACQRMIKRVEYGTKQNQYFVEPYCSFCLTLMEELKQPQQRIESARSLCNKNKRLVTCKKGFCVYEDI